MEYFGECGCIQYCLNWVNSCEEFFFYCKFIRLVYEFIYCCDKDCGYFCFCDNWNCEQLMYVWIFEVILCI